MSPPVFDRMGLRSFAEPVQPGRPSTRTLPDPRARREATIVHPLFVKIAMPALFDPL
jgi:hypothetical protein